jgi:hypothetical protein
VVAKEVPGSQLRRARAAFAELQLWDENNRPSASSMAG